MEIGALQTALHKQRFQPFKMRLADGRQIVVRHPDFVATSKQRVIVIDADESWSVLEPLLIVSLDFAEGADIGQPETGNSEA